MKLIKRVKKFLIGGDEDNSTPTIVSEPLNENPVKGAKLFLKSWYDNPTSRQMLETVHEDIKSKVPNESPYGKKINESLDDRLQKANDTNVYRIEHKINGDGTVTMAPKGLESLGRRGLINVRGGRGFVYPELTDESGNPVSKEEADYRWRKALSDFYNSENSSIGGVYNPSDKEIYMPVYNSYLVNPITHELEHAYNDIVPETMYSTDNINYKLKNGVQEDRLRDSPTERTARLMQLRQELDLNPDKRDYTNKDVAKMLKQLAPGQLKDDLNRIEEQSIANMLNFIAYNSKEKNNSNQNNNYNFNRFSNNENQNVSLAKLGTIKIKPENKGKFTNKANMKGLSVQEFANKVLNNKENYNISTIKQANFAKNANKWNKKRYGWNSNDSSTGNLNESITKFVQGIPEGKRVKKGKTKEYFIRKYQNVARIKVGKEPLSLDDLLESDTNFNNGKFGGAGASETFITKQYDNYNQYEEKKLISTTKSFSDAFSEARKNGQSTFIFDGKKYNTNISKNPKYIGKLYETNINGVVRKVYEKEDGKNMELMRDSTRIEPYIGQRLGIRKRDKSEYTNKKFENGGKISYLDYNPGIIDASVNALGNIGGSIASYFTNKKFLDKMEAPKEPMMLQHNKRITKVNINPQLREIKNSVDRLKKSVIDNTASSSKALNELRQIESSKVDKLSDIYAQKENIENNLINQDIAARSEVDKYNLEQANKYRDSVINFNNKKYDLMSENTQGLISGLTDSINSIISEIGQNRAQKDNERMILAKSNISADEAKDKGLSVAPAWDIQRAKRREERKSKREDRKKKNEE